MIDLISMINGVLTFVEKLQNQLLRSKQLDSAKVDAVRKDAQEILRQISELISKFSETVDLILGTLETGYPVHDYHAQRRISLAELYGLNRRLYEISTDMEILTTSLSARFKEAEESQIKRLKDLCLQVVYIEDFLGVTLGNRSEGPVSTSHMYHGPYSGLYLRHAPEKLPFAVSGIDEYIDGMFRYFAELLKRLLECKRQIAAVLQEIAYADPAEQERT